MGDAPRPKPYSVSSLTAELKGALEARFTRVNSTQIEVALYRWNKSGRKVTANFLTKGMLTISGNNATLDMGDLPSGVYVLNVKGNRVLHRQTIVKTE